jgi:translation initiation factor 1
MKKRIETDGGASLGANPFDGLSSEGLPDPAPKKAGQKRVSKKAKQPVRKGRVELRREKSGRGGKTVTTLSAFAPQLPLSELEQLAFDLKKACACGGTKKGRTIELQGDVRDRVFTELEARGFQPVRAGG